MEIFGIGIGEMLLIAVVALMILGPERLPEAARTMGKFIGDIRRATEPARSAMKDITDEINRAANSATTVNQKPSGNPWEVHPVMQGMTEEERERFMAGGEMPERIAQQLEAGTLLYGSSNGTSPEELPELDYPMPHTELAYRPPGALEELDYPPPG
jgi:sec-independent protein translocase protein TatB